MPRKNYLVKGPQMGDKKIKKKKMSFRAFRAEVALNHLHIHAIIELAEGSGHSLYELLRWVAQVIGHPAEKHGNHGLGIALGHPLIPLQAKVSPRLEEEGGEISVSAEDVARQDRALLSTAVTAQATHDHLGLHLALHLHHHVEGATHTL